MWGFCTQSLSFANPSDLMPYLWGHRGRREALPQFLTPSVTKGSIYEANCCQNVEVSPRNHS